MNGPGGVGSRGPTERLVMIGANNARTCREVSYGLKDGGYIKFTLPQAKELEKGVSRAGMIELGPEPKVTLKLEVAKGALFRFNEQISAYNNFMARQRSGRIPAAALEGLQKYIDSLILLGQAVTLLRLDEPGNKASPEVLPVIGAVMGEVAARWSGLDPMISTQDITYPERMEKQLRGILGIYS
jgi:hypothetical protein